MQKHHLYLSAALFSPLLTLCLKNSDLKRARQLLQTVKHITPESLSTLEKACRATTNDKEEAHNILELLNKYKSKS